MKKNLLKIAIVSICLVLGLAMFVACSDPNEPDPVDPNPTEFDSTKAINVVSREVGSGTRDAFTELIYGSTYPVGITPVPGYNYWQTIMLPDNTVTQNSTAAVMAKIVSDKYAIGYDSLGYVTSSVKKLKVGNVECTAENVRNGSYTIARPLSVVYKAATLGTTVNQKFYDFLESAEAQTIIGADGYVNDPTRTTAYVVDGTLTGTIKVSGSTSLQPLMIKLAEAFEVKQPNVTVEVTGGGSGTGRNNVRDNLSEFGMVSSPVTGDQLTAIGGSAAVLKVCDDGIAIIVNVSNPLNNITIDQLKNIYNHAATTKYSNWGVLIG
ncbi:MAG: substrate-binding domain-containing protein [Firmicutes bacterium]|nr:substrate-binding domain-containing protein [Bacillota bacterium]